MHIVCYNFSNDKRKIDKNLTEVIRYENVRFFKDCSIVNPIIEVTNIADIVDIDNINYIAIPRLGRKYFVTDTTISIGGSVIFSCHCDVLESFKEDILSTKQTIGRQENKKNLWIPDESLPIHSDRFTEIHYLDSCGFDNSSDNADKSGYFLILATTGNGGT